MNAIKKIKVLIVDDSALMRQLLTAVLHEDPIFYVVGTAANPLIAREKIKTLNPDVLTLDVEMPGMDGITFLEKLMRLRPMPVVMVSSLTKQGATATLRALDLGAVDFVTKPQANGLDSMSEEVMEEIRAKVRTAAMAHVRTLAPSSTVLTRARPLTLTASPGKNRFVAIGASAGGTQAIAEILPKLPPQTPGIAIVQHMPPKFTAMFAERLNDQCQLDVREAKDGDSLIPGVALVAPGGYHMSVVRSQGGYAVRVYAEAQVNRHCPSVDVLFHSVSECASENALGIILTGMGSDGAVGLRTMKDAGSYTIAQDEKSCVVFGMPDQAIRRGGACEVMPLEAMASRIVEWAGANKQVKGA